MRSWMAGSSAAAGPDMLNLVDLDFGDGRFARITLDRLTKGRHRYLECRLDGTEATIETELGGALELQFGVRAATRRPFFNGDFSAGGRAFLWRGENRRKLASDGFNLFADATRKLLRAFLLSIRDETVPPCSLDVERPRQCRIGNVSISASGRYLDVKFGGTSGDSAAQAHRIYEVDPTTLAIRPHAMAKWWLKKPGEQWKNGLNFLIRKAHGK